MNNKQSLKQRITVAFFLLTFVLCGSFAVVIYFIIHELESKLFYDHLQQDAEWIIKAHQQGIPLELPSGITFYQTNKDEQKQLPDYLKNLSESHTEVILKDSAYHVIVQNQENLKYYLVQDQSQFEQIELILARGIILAFIIALAISLWLGTATARHVIKPVIRLANQVKRLENAPSQEQLNTDSFSDDEVGQLATTFKNHTQRLHQFIQRERLFTGDVSHELRTPLMIISGSCELLLNQAQLEPKTAQRLARIQRATQEMSNLVNTFLKLSREGNHAKLALETFAAQTIINEELRELRKKPKANKLTIELKTEMPLQLHAEPHLFRIAMRNLLQNALHHTQTGHIIVRIQNNAIEIEDSGSGIPLEVQTSIFQRHVQGDEVNVHGQGLGLSIVERICQHHHWSIHFKPVTPHGSHFTLRVI
ncbi:MAG: HAMP domain-containing sensor histidine kinase [Gammaproteobacteria bacterium]|nr:HAMP domain-containing sensor histidine kinase [Gammaproteobacteria bacterium]